MLYNTSKEARHKHIAYLRQDGTGSTSTVRKHSHNIIRDEETGQWYLDEANGHIHTLTEEYTPPEPTYTDVGDNEEEVVSHALALYERAKETERESRTDAREANDFYCGKQWDKITKKALESTSRAALTINMVAAGVDTLSGHFRQNRSDFKFYPVEEGDSRVAEILDIVVKNICDNSNMPHEETQVFNDQVVAGRGIFNVYVDYDKNIEGDIVIEKLPWEDVYTGPHEKMDLGDCEYIVIRKILSKNKIKQLWPKKAKDIEAYSNLDFDKEGDVQLEMPGYNYDISDNMITMGKDILWDGSKKEFMVFEIWKKVFRRKYIAINIADDFYMEVSEADAVGIRGIEGFRIVERKVTDLRNIKVAGRTLLENDIDDTIPEFNGSRDFNICIAYAKKNKLRWWGKVHEVIDVQRELNKRRSQTVDIMNRMASYFWMYDDETFRTPHEATEFKNNSSTPGAFLKVANADRPPKKDEGVKMPNELVHMEQASMDSINRIMGINPEMQGFGGSDISGKAIIEKRRSGLVANEYLFDHMNMAKKALARRIVSYIQEVYDTDRIIRLLRNQQAQGNVNDQGVMMELQQDEMAIRTLLDEADLTKYDVVVEQSPYSPTVRSANFAVWLEAAKQGMQIPPDFLIELSDLPDKNKYLQLIRGAQQQAAETEKGKQETEIKKTLIAAQSKQGGGTGQGLQPPGAPPAGPQADVPQVPLSRQF